MRKFNNKIQENVKILENRILQKTNDLKKKVISNKEFFAETFENTNQLIEFAENSKRGKIAAKKLVEIATQKYQPKIENFETCDLTLLISSLTKIMKTNNSQEIILIKLVLLIFTQDNRLSKNELEKMFITILESLNLSKNNNLEVMIYFNFVFCIENNLIDKKSKVLKFLKKSSNETISKNDYFQVENIESIFNLFEIFIKCELMIFPFSSFNLNYLKDFFKNYQFQNLEILCKEFFKNIVFEKLDGFKYALILYQKTFIKISEVIDAEERINNLSKEKQEQISIKFKEIETKLSIKSEISVFLNTKISFSDQQKSVQYFLKQFDYFSSDFSFENLFKEQLISEFKLLFDKNSPENQKQTVENILVKLNSTFLIKSTDFPNIKKEFEIIFYIFWLKSVLNNCDVPIKLQEKSSPTNLKNYSLEKVFYESNEFCKKHQLHCGDSKLREIVYHILKEIVPEESAHFFEKSEENGEFINQKKQNEFLNFRKQYFYLFDFELAESEAFLQKYNIEKLRGEYMKAWCTKTKLT